MRAEGFFRNLDVLYGGLGIGKLECLILIKIEISKFILGHQNPESGLDPDRDRYSAKNAESGSVSNEYGSETLNVTMRMQYI